MTSRMSVGSKGYTTPRQPQSSSSEYDSPGGLPTLSDHDIRGAPSYLSSNPLTGSLKNRDKSIELQQLSGSNPIHPLLADYKAEAESWWSKHANFHRGVIISCGILGIFLACMVAVERHISEFCGLAGRRSALSLERAMSEGRRLSCSTWGRVAATGRRSAYPAPSLDTQSQSR
eukprot:scaffold172391_cov39-Prasinocladus_malaysianus.AAC.2